MRQSGQCESFNRLCVILWLIMGGWTSRRCLMTLKFRNTAHQSVFAVVNNNWCVEKMIAYRIHSKISSTRGREGLKESHVGESSSWVLQQNKLVG